jgi:DNA polymerase bacteriophage-type
MDTIGLDFETYGSVNLLDHGLYRYTEDKFFTPLIGSVVRRESRGFFERCTFNFVTDRKASRRDLTDMIGGSRIAAHNAGFEMRVLNVLGCEYPASRFIDSAVVARAGGFGGHLESAAPQMLGIDKMELGKQLIRLFSIPGKYQEASGSPAFDPQIIADHPVEWADFISYCELDAELSLRIVERGLGMLTVQELEYMTITMEMNDIGWCVDLDIVEEMQRRYIENQEEALFAFRSSCNAPDLNLNSHKQLKDWCAARGIKAKSFDEKHVAAMLKAVTKKLENVGQPLDPAKAAGYAEVMTMLQTKQILGGSSLKKLQTIIDTASADYRVPTNHRLKDQYLHAGAGQSCRTTGRSTQMQNLKRLEVPADMDELWQEDTEWDNDRLAVNIRQVFTASQPTGLLIVGDFSSVEAIGLAWLAGQQSTLQAARAGIDLYKAQAVTNLRIPLASVTPQQRTFSKVGVLSCGYQAGGPAVQSFAEGMGVTLSEAEAAKVVWDFREGNPDIVRFWYVLNEMLHSIVEDRALSQTHELADGHRLKMIACSTPESLLNQHPGARSVSMQMYGPSGNTVMKRYFHGCYTRGNNIAYYKPSNRKTGDLWRATYTDPKTGFERYHELYGGKVAGILTQSLCREIFMESLRALRAWTREPVRVGQIGLVGQFHDEAVLDWQPGATGLDATVEAMDRIMSDPGDMVSFPLRADIKYAYRYIK